MPQVTNSTQSPCWQQREIAKQRAYIHTIQQKKSVTYTAPCDFDAPVVPSKQTS